MKTKKQTNPSFAAAVAAINDAVDSMDIAPLIDAARRPVTDADGNTDTPPRGRKLRAFVWAQFAGSPEGQRHTETARLMHRLRGAGVKTDSDGRVII